MTSIGDFAFYGSSNISVFMTDVVRINLGISNFATGQSFYGATNANIIDKLL